MSKLFLDILDSNRKDTFEKLKNFNNIGVLGGGTALALQIGHRISYDFDIFINQNIDKNIWRKSKNIFGQDSTKILENEDQLDLITPNNIKVTFFKDDYESIFEPVSNTPINFMDVRDIATNKAYIQGRRPKWRDYVDLFFLLSDKYITLDELISLSKKKFKTDFSDKLFLEQLVYWDDIKSYEIEFVNEDIDPDKIKTYLTKTVRSYKKEFI